MTQRRNIVSLIGKQKKNNQHRSLSGILLFSFLSFFMAVFLVMGSLFVFIIFQNQQQIVFSRHRLAANYAAAAVEGFFKENFIAMETTARLVNPAFTSHKEQQRLLNYLFGSHTAFRQLVLISSERQQVEYVSRLSTVLTREIINEKIIDESFDLARKGKRYISEVHIDTATNEPMVVVAVPSVDVFGDFHGVLAVEVNLKFMWDLVKSLEIGKSGVAYVVDRQGRLIAFGDISRVLRNENVGNIKIVNEFIRNPPAAEINQVEIFSGINGAMVIGSFVSLGEPDFALVTEQPVMEAFITVIHFWVILLAFAIIIWVLVVWISIRLASRLSIPLVNLMETAIRISSGERGLRADVSGPMEIARMADAFNSMTVQLNEVIKSLEQRSRHLQTTVQEYVEYMDEVGEGSLELRLTLKEYGEETTDPLIMLGRQLNDTTANLQKKIEQIQYTTTKLLRQEEKLKMYSEKLERSNKELEQFAYVASHDLQEPLRKLIFFGDRLKKNYGNILDGNAIDYIDRMNNAVLRMQSFIRDLLQYSRVTTKTKPFETVDLNEIIKEVIGDLEIRIRETGAEIKIEHLPKVYADPLQMRQLFQNIIGNALKYHRENVLPVIDITSRAIANEDRDYGEIEIRDNGIGFDNKYADQIFGLFQRLHGKNEYEGTGIGLSICKKIVEQHGGVIRAFGKEGEGSTFCITLPLKQEHNQ